MGKKQALFKATGHTEDRDSFSLKIGCNDLQEEYSLKVVGLLEDQC